MKDKLFYPTILWVLFIAFAVMTQLHSKTLNDTLIQAGKPYDLSYTLRAIVINESSGGKFKINLQDPSCGITMIHLKFFLKRHNKVDTPLNRNIACQNLVQDDLLAIAEAIDILQYWKTTLCGRNKPCTKEGWRKVWGAYNAGNNYNSKRGKEYASKIKRTIDLLVEHDKKEAKKSKK